MVFATIRCKSVFQLFHGYTYILISDHSIVYKQVGVGMLARFDETV